MGRSVLPDIIELHFRDVALAAGRLQCGSCALARHPRGDCKCVGLDFWRLCGDVGVQW